MTELRVLETNILHASDVIYWLDGSSAEEPADMLHLAEVLQLQLTTRPRDLQVVHGSGRTALLRRPAGPLTDGVASEAQRARPAAPSFEVAGVVSHPAGRYIPRRFTLSAGNGAGHHLVVYPSPLGTRFGPAGGLAGTLRFDPGGAPASWALLTLEVDTGLGATLRFRCQANAVGDFLLPFHRLPPLPEGVDSYAASLSVAALDSASPEVALDHADLEAMDLGALDSDDTFSSSIALAVVPGTISPIRSSSRDHVAVQPH